jgi:hypothetical protein
MVGYDYLVRGITEHVDHTRSGGSSHGYGAGEGKIKMNISVGGGEGWLDKGGIPFLAGCLARTVSATICSPLELFRTRLQARPAGEFNISGVCFDIRLEGGTDLYCFSSA